MLVSPRIVQQRGRLRLLAVSVLMVAAFFVFKHQKLSMSSSWSLLSDQKAPSACHPDLAALDGLKGDLTPAFRYSRRCVQAVFRPEHTSTSHAAVRRRPTVMDGHLIPETVVINRTADCGPPQPLACEPLALEVTQPYPSGNYSHLLFGVASSHTRMLQALDGFAHWLGGTEGRLVAIVQEEDGTIEEEAGDGGAVRQTREENKNTLARLAGLEQAYRARGVHLTALPPQNRAARTVVQNHFAILGVLLDVASPSTHWLGIVDDDTFVPSLYKLDQTLRRYNASRSTWLGALSEDFDSVARWGYMAYGGAGVFLSVPLARELRPHMAECLRARAGGPVTGSLLVGATSSSSSTSNLAAGAVKMTGDGLLRDCIYRHTTTKLTVVPGLYQHDLYGDLSGFYESGVLPLSVHHWRSWYKVPMAKMAGVTQVCGDCFLGRWLWTSPKGTRTNPSAGGVRTDSLGTSPGATLLSNGYSITQYQALPDLAQMELTWSHAGSEFDFSLGPLRPALNETQKKSFRLKEAIVDKTGLRQVYVYKGDFGTDEMDEVFELVWSLTEVVNKAT
ncbi:hypothetical protein SEUCBS139899_002014 [Sporothrix eucalyptigena]|uniref:Fringe-like glycosyltransferase domain-containing protein n=1 Tax=Sporothrix eucalyptigena TaxID=1812306 RepID=A0ABP0CBU3_9PEZI